MQGVPEEYMVQHSPGPTVLPCLLYGKGGPAYPGIVVVGSTIQMYVYRNTEWTRVDEDDEYSMSWQIG